MNIKKIMKTAGIAGACGTAAIMTYIAYTSPKKTALRKNCVKKKILVVCQYYHPEPFRIKDICEELVRRGHEVQVVTGYPNYPEGQLYDGYGKGKRIDEIINGVKVHRCYTIPRQTGILNRLLNYYSYAFSASSYVLGSKCRASDGTNFDEVFCNQLSPVMMTVPAIVYKKRYGVPIVMYCLDLWPESLIVGGIKRDSFIYKHFYRVSKRIYGQMDRILVTSRMFQDYLSKNFRIENERIEYLPQYAEDIFEPLAHERVDGIFHFMLAGNIGTAQSIETVLGAAERLQHEPIKFHIIGGGTELKRLKKLKKEKGLHNVVFYGRRPLSDMPGFYEMADAMLVTLLADPALRATLPGKVQSYMAAGKPIIGAADGEIASVIKEARCGFCGGAKDDAALAENIMRFVHADNKPEMGINARRFYEANFEKGIFMDKLERELDRALSMA